MKQKHEIDEDLQNVVRHFKYGTLLPQSGWQRFKLTNKITTHRRRNIAASIAAAVLAASASIYYYGNSENLKENQREIEILHEHTPEISVDKSEKIYFKDASLKEVVNEIERIYGVTITNVPQEDKRITISYEGTASDVVETINDLMGINLTIASKQE